jgi:hypothetical protein
VFLPISGVVARAVAVLEPLEVAEDSDEVEEERLVFAEQGEKDWLGER